MRLICKTSYFQKGLLSLGPEGRSVWHCLWHGPWIDEGQNWSYWFNKQGLTSRNLGALPPGNASCIPPAPDWEREMQTNTKRNKRQIQEEMEIQKRKNKRNTKSLRTWWDQMAGRGTSPSNLQSIVSPMFFVSHLKGPVRCFDIIKEHFQKNFWLISLLTFKDRDLLKGVADTELV